MGNLPVSTVTGRKEKVKTLNATIPTMTPAAKNMKAIMSQITPHTERGFSECSPKTERFYL
jgi:hypothetical protein